MTFLIYEDVERGIRIKYPEGWDVIEDEWRIDLAFTAPYEVNGIFNCGTSCEQSHVDNFRGSVVVGVEDLSKEPMTLEELNELTLQEIKKDEDLQEIFEQTPAKLAGQNAYKMGCIVKRANYEIKFWQIWALKDNKLYGISYSHSSKYFLKYKHLVEEMANSFEILK